jgi:predicted O-methyltransferase YrrM
VLEVGCAVGLTSAYMSKYLDDGGTVTTIDRYDDMIVNARKNFDLLGVTDRVKLIEGDALEILPHLTAEYDFIFLDAAKGQYPFILPHCLQLLPVGGVLLADDVEMESPTRRDKTRERRLNDFLDMLYSNDELETSVLPIGKGVSVSVRKPKR